MIMIVILLFNLLFRSMPSFRGVRAYSCSNAYVKRKPGWLVSVSEAPGAVSPVHVDSNEPLVVV